jgi:hypothetical protein
MSNTNYKGDEMKINAMAFLQEFYGKGILDRFCEACEEYQCNALDAVLTLKYLLMNNLALEQSYPDFPDLAEMYARRMDLDAEEFTHNFYIPRRDQQ